MLSNILYAATTSNIMLRLCNYWQVYYQDDLFYTLLIATSLNFNSSITPYCSIQCAVHFQDENLMCYLLLIAVLNVLSNADSNSEYGIYS